MADDAKTLLIKVDAAVGLAQSNLRKLERQIESLEKGGNSSLKKFDAGVKRTTTGITGGFDLAKTAVVGFGAGFVGGLISTIPGTLIAAARASLELGSSLAETSQQLGVTVEDLQQYRFIADQVGISQEEMDKGLRKLTLSIGQAASGSKKQAAAFDELNISVTDSSGKLKLAGAVLPELVAALSEIPDPAKRAALEVAIFGKTGQSLEPLLGGGIAQLNKLSAEYRELGIALSADQAKKLDDSADALAKFQKQAQGEFTIFLADSGVLDELVDGLKATRKELEFLYNTYKKVRDFLGLGTPVKIPVGTGSPGTAADYAKPTAGPRRSSASDFLKPQGGPRKSGIAFPSFLNLAIDIESLVAPVGASTPPKALQAITAETIKLDAALADALPKLGELLDDAQVDFGPQRTIYDDLGIDATGELKTLVDDLDDKFNDTQQRFRDKMEANVQFLAGTLEELFNGGFDNVIKNFEQKALAVVAEILAQLAVSAFGGGGKFDFGSSLFSAVGSVFGFGGFREGGGPVSAGQAYVVGEKRPELFVPNTNGFIAPRLPSLGGGGASTVNVTINAPGATAETTLAIRREIAAAAPTIVAAATQNTRRTLSRPRI